jgi:hypothetical protein
LLNYAIDRVMEKVEEALTAKRIDVNLNKYVAAVRDKLTFPAKEMQKLSEKLVESRHTAKLGAKEELVSDAGDHLIVHELV